ncbi:MAG: SLBB domain-containing protein [Armatimonadetes bacterium]|nr:SLBB domain-containing protein [Armatimonadota bacterium]MCX7968002.1 SLBB domain-containing protein [Armatimonadota bacterium]MDW8142049.1 SLBB domain-containing protein [Armatimonadota bacterium]
MKEKWFGVFWLLILLSSLLLAQPTTSQPEAYRLNPGDQIQILIEDEPELSGEFTVGPDGFIRLRLIGSVQAAGLTVDELATQIEKALRQYLREPKVIVNLKQFTPLARRVYIMGAVKAPGAYPLPLVGPTTVFDAIMLAGGFSDNADWERVKVFKRDGQVQTVNLRNLQAGDLTGGGIVQPGDVIWVPPAYIVVNIVGAISKNGVFSVPTKATLLDAIALAGGVTDPSANVRVFRGGIEMLSVPWGKLIAGEIPTIQLQENDTILISVKDVSGVVVTGMVQRPGMLNLVGKVTLLGVLAMAGAPLSDQRPMRVKVIRQGQEVLSVKLDAAKSAPAVNELAMELQSGDIVSVEPLTVRVTLLGAVQKPGTYEVPIGLRVMDLLSHAGGLMATANISNISINRRGEVITLNLTKLWEGDLNQNPELQDSDLILVPASQRIWVTGAVQRPGSFEYLPNMTILDAIGMAGGPRSLEESDLSAVKIISGDTARTVNLEGAFRTGAFNLEPIRPGDIIVVPERAKAYVFGAVARPGAIGVKTGDTVLTVISNAGGPAPDAKLDEVVLVRIVKDKPVVTKLNLNQAIQKGDPSQSPPVQPGDVLYVSRKRRGEGWEDFARILGLANSIALMTYYLGR